MSLIKKTSILSDSRFPSFIRGDSNFDMLRQFVKSYFESLEEVGKANYELIHAQDNSDVDTVTSEFLDRFYTSICPDLPVNVLADKRLLLKHSRELYQKKGTPDSFKLLFKILYNETINIKYPSENILRASDGKWNQPVAIHALFYGVDDTTILNSNGLEITAINSTGIIRNTAIQIKKIFGTSTYEITIDKQKNIRFEIGDTIKIGDISGVIVPSTQSVNIIKQGKNFKLGQIIKLDIDGGKGSLAKITEITSNGGIKNIKIIKYGTGYSADFNLTIVPTVFGITNVYTTGIDGAVLPLNESTYGYEEYGVISKIGSYGSVGDYFLEDYITSDYISTPYRYFGGITQTQSVESDEYAIISIKIGSILSYPGFWSNNNGRLSEPLICLQDNQLYQNFSYLIQSPVPLNTFYKPVKELLHPAGMIMFSDMLLENTIDLSNEIVDQSGMTIDMYVNDIVDTPELVKKSISVKKYDTSTQTELVKKSFIAVKSDTTSPQEYSSYFSSDYASSDYTSIVYGPIKYVSQKKTDSVTNTDSIKRGANKTLTDATTGAIDSKLDITYTVMAADSVTPSETAPFGQLGYSLPEDYITQTPVDGVVIKVN